MKKKLPLVLSFALAALIVVGQASLAQGSDDNNRTVNMMNGDGMTTMMKKGNMSEMMNACIDFMQSFGNDKKER